MIKTQQQDSTFVKPNSTETNLFQDTSQSFNFFEAKNQSIIQLDSSTQPAKIKKTQLQRQYAYIPKAKTDLEIDTIPHELYNIDTIPFLLEYYQSDNIIQKDFIFSMKSLKPQDKKEVEEKIVIEKSAKNDNLVDKEENQIIPVAVQKESDIKVFNSNFQYKSNTNWQVGVILLSVVIFGLTRLMFRGIIANFIKAATNYQVALKAFIDSNILTKQASAFIDSLFFVNISLLIFQLMEYKNIGLFRLTGIKVFLIIFSFILIIYLGKSLIHRFLGYVLLIQKEMAEYIYQIFLYNKIAGMLLLPFVASFPFIPFELRPAVIYTAIILLILIYIIRIFRGILISFKNKLSVFYIILYLCTLEILPIIVFCKLFVYYLGV